MTKGYKSGIKHAWTLPKKLLARIVNKLDSPSVRGIALGGSYARGEAGVFSDVDILPLMRDDAEMPGKRFLLDKGKLVSVSPKTGASIREQMSRPEKAIWVVPGVDRVRYCWIRMAVWAK